MEKLISGPLAEALSRNRERYNRLFAQATQRSSLLDQDDFGQLVRGTLQPLVDAMAKVFPERTESAAGELFEICLALFSQGYLGQQSRNPLLPALWQQLLPAVPALLARSPRQLAGALSNAAINLWQEDQDTAQRWLKKLYDLTDRFETTGQLLDASLVLAWRSGLAHYRESALPRWHNLPDNLRLACLGISSDPAPTLAVIAQALQNRWYPPDLAGKETELQLSIVARTGRFRGVSGQFAEPPLVASDGEAIVAYDGEASFGLWSDFYGSTLRRTSQTSGNSSGQGQSGFSIDQNGTVRFGAFSRSFPPLAGCSSFAATADTLAVTLPHSHSIYVVAPLVVEKKP